MSFLFSWEKRLRFAPAFSVSRIRPAMSRVSFIAASSTTTTVSSVNLFVGGAVVPSSRSYP